MVIRPAACPVRCRLAVRRAHVAISGQWHRAARIFGKVLEFVYNVSAIYPNCGNWNFWRRSVAIIGTLSGLSQRSLKLMPFSQQFRAFCRLYACVRGLLPALGLVACGLPSTGLAANADPIPAEPLVVITGAGPALENNIRAFLSIRNEACSTSPARLRRLLPQVRRQLAEAASALGYYHAEGDARFGDSDGCWRLDIAVTPGPRVVLGTVDVSVIGDAAVQEQFADILQATPLASGLP
ncbi:MAG: POTRA domain-containing protein, partial [Pseudomonadota bacterium]|nr:POTRA domain-containing protein [Pseudomonadota bacterium]